MIDFESTAPSVQVGETRPQDDFETTTHVAGGGGDADDADADRSHNSTKRKIPGSSSLSSSSRWPSPAQSNGDGSGPLGQQQCIRDFLPPSNPGAPPAATPQPSAGRSGTSRAWEPEETRTSAAEKEEAAMDRHGTEQRLGSGVAGGNRWGRRNDAATGGGGQNKHRAGRGSVRSGGGRGGRGRGRSPASRGGRRGGRKNGRRGNIGKDAGDRMGQALAEWAWEYFCTPWGATEEGDSSPGRSSAAGAAAGLRSPPLPAPPQLRKPEDSGPEVVAPCAVGGRSQRLEPTGWRGSSAPALPPTTAIPSSSSLSAGAAAAAAALLRQQMGQMNDAGNEVAFCRNGGGHRQVAGPGRPGAGADSAGASSAGAGSAGAGSAAVSTAAAFVDTPEKLRNERPPPPLYFQHDGHSRSVVGVLWPGGRKSASNVNEGSANGRGGGGAGKVESTGRSGRGGRGGRGTGGKRQPGSLLVFDPSHEGGELRNALDNTQKPGWGR